MQLKTRRLQTLKPNTTKTTTTTRTKSTSPIEKEKEKKEYQYGSKVEVSSDEEGFRGVWFIATVIKPPSSPFQQSPSKIYVEYNNLLSEENRTSLLREFVDVKFVRPEPPLDDNKVVNFEENDIVDAYYQDGWWSGVITKVVEPDSKYRVFFPNPPDEILFSFSDLRVHRTWVNGIWVIPSKQRMWGLNFNPLTAVEVNLDTDSSRDVWFPATVVKQVSKDYFLVEYRSSKEAGFQKVGIDSLHIRPLPPSSIKKTFGLLEKVDTFCDCRWLSGIVRRILADGRYIVYFKCIREEKELSHEDLRLHMEWTNGKWVHSSQDTSMTPMSETQSVRPNGGNNDTNCAPCEDSVVKKANNGHVRISAVTLRRRENDSPTTGSDKADSISTIPSNKRNKQTNAYGDVLSSRPSTRSDEEAVCDAALSPDTTQKVSLDTSVDLKASAPDHQRLSSLKEDEDSNRLSDSVNIKGNYEKHVVRQKRGRPRKSRAVVAETVDLLPTRNELVDAVLDPLEETIDQTSTRTDPVNAILDALVETVDQTPTRSDDVRSYGPVVIGLTLNGHLINSRAASSGSRMKMKRKAVEDEGKQLNAFADPESTENGPQKESKVTNMKRKRGRPPKVVFQLGSPKTNEAVPEVVASKMQDIEMEGSAESLNLAAEVVKPIAVIEPLSISNSTPPSEACPSDASPSNAPPSDAPPSDTHPSDALPRDAPSRECVNFVSDQFKRLADSRRLSFGKRSTTRRQAKRQKKIPRTAIVERADTFILRGKKLKSIEQPELPTEDAIDNPIRRTGEHPDNGVGADMSVVSVASSNASDDDKPLSAWLDGAYSPPLTDRSKEQDTDGQFVGTREIQNVIETPPCSQSNEKALERSNEAPVVDNDATIRQYETPIQSTALVPSEHPELPFVKNSLIWGVIESMEVFKRIPQKPHFLPLYDCKEECREGLAIGSMVTFTSLAERISKSHFDDPQSLFDGYLEALVDMEKLGFNVTPVRDLLHRQLSIKSRYEQAQNMSIEMESQIMEEELEKSKIIDEIEELEKKIKELKEKHALAVSKKEKKESEIALLKSSVEATKSSLESAQEEFQKVTASLW